jgi:hypothetical protein
MTAKRPQMLTGKTLADRITGGALGPELAWFCLEPA